MVLDDSKGFSVVYVVPQAQIVMIRASVTHAGVTTDYDVLPGNVQPIAQENDSVFIAVQIKNIGGDGDCYVQVLKDGIELYNYTAFMVTNEVTAIIVALGKASANPFTMAKADVSIVVNGGH